MRWFIDFAAIFLATVTGIAATGSNWGGFVAAALIGIYGWWCFYDGMHATHPTKDTKQ